MEPAIDILSVAHVIQQAVAPVFLLTGIGAILGVLSGRLGRVIDRFRTLDRMPDNERHTAEIAILQRRSLWIHRAITLCTLSALFICIVIAALFIGAEFGKDPSTTIALLFVAAMLTLITALLCFLREIALSTGNIGLHDK